jgi:hypothetical protein
MATGAEVLAMLRPNGGWVIRGDDFSGIDWVSCEPLTQKEFEDGFNQYDIFKTQQDSEKATARQSLLERLGITEEEAKLLLS